MNADTLGQVVQRTGQVGAECRPGRHVGAEKGAEIRVPPRFSAPAGDAVAAQDQGSEGQGRLVGLAPWPALLPMESAYQPIASDPDLRYPAV
jgi:hypothetical protein